MEAPFLLWFWPGFNRDDAAYAAAHGEFSGHAHPARITSIAHLIEEPVSDRFVKDALIAEAVVIELERFQLNARLVGDVLQFNRGEVGHSCDRAHGCELRGEVVDHVIPVRCGIGESFQN